MHARVSVCLSIAAALLATAALAQPQGARIPRERYVLAEAYAQQNIGKLVRQLTVTPHWIGDGADFWYVRETAEGDLYLRVDGHTGRARPLFDQAALAAALAKASGEAVDASRLALKDAQLDAKASRLAFSHGGKAYSLDLRTGTLQPAAAKAHGVVSPDGQWRIETRGYNLFLVSIKTGEERRLTTDGSAAQPYARPVVNPKLMVAQGRQDPVLEPDVAWSPDSRWIATYRMDLRKARKLAMVESTPRDGSKPKLFVYDYALAGDTDTATAQPLVFAVDTGRAVALDLPPQPMLYYVGQGFVWSRDSRQVLLQTTGRGYRRIQVHSFDPATGKGRVAAEERADTYIDPFSFAWRYVDAKDGFAWLSERSGRLHLWFVDAKSGAARQLTSGDWQIHYLEHVDQKTGEVLFLAGGREPGQSPYLGHLYRIDLTGQGLTSLTPEPVDHSVSVSPDGGVFVDNMSKVDQPTRSVLRRASDGKIIAELGHADVSALLAGGFVMPEPFSTLAADGKTPIYGVVYRPAGFDAKRAANASLPVIDNIYSGPHFVMAPTSFADALVERNTESVAQIGAVVVNVDGRGTAHRSRQFLDVAYKNLNEVGLDDHVKAIRDLAERYPYLDAGRVGVYGFSVGGYDVVRAMERRPDFYKVGLSASGNHDNRLDKAIWNEIWMGAELGPVYDRNSNVTHADRLTGKLMLAYGELDENVPTSATLRLVDALIAANKDFELLVVPGADHFLDANPYYNRRRLDFFTRQLLGAEPPADYRFAPFEP